MLSWGNNFTSIFSIVEKLFVYRTMQTSITISLILFVSLCHHITHGIPLEPAPPLKPHHHYTISLKTPNPEPIRVRRSATISETLNQASTKLAQVINNNGGISKVNSDIQAAYNVMYSEEVQSDPVLREAVKFNPNGHICSVSLCDSIGQMQISLGACTQHFCHCGSGKAFVKTCGQGTIYDAFLQNCNWPNEVEYCKSR